MQTPLATGIVYSACCQGSRATQPQWSFAELLWEFASTFGRELLLHPSVVENVTHDPTRFPSRLCSGNSSPMVDC